jgi:hypothetical protein
LEQAQFPLTLSPVSDIVDNTTEKRLVLVSLDEFRVAFDDAVLSVRGLEMEFVRLGVSGFDCLVDYISNPALTLRFIEVDDRFE